MSFKVYASLIGLMLLAITSVLHAEAPPSPAKLNITPVYQDLWLPDSYVPKEFRIDSQSVAANPSDPPRKSGSSQFFIIEVPHPSMGGKISVSSNVDDWIKITLSRMKVYPLIQNAKDIFAYDTYYYSSYTRKVDIGDQALFRPWTEWPWKPNRNMLDKTTHQWDYRSTEGIVRIGRVIFHIGIRGNLEIDRVDTDTGKGFVSYQGSITLKECPTREELDDKMRQVVDGVRSYADSMGWMKDGDVKKVKPSATVSTSKKTSDGKSKAGDSSSTDNDSSIPEFTPAELAAASSLAGGAALVGALMLMGMSGVGREDIVQAIRDLLRGHVPADSFDAWKQKYEALGWQYNVKDGVATFDPVDGCRNEEGLIWSSQKGAFIRPDAPVESASVSAIPKDGDVNEQGEVWSSLSGGYVDRKMYEQDLASRADIAEAGRLRYDDNVYVREARTDFIEAKKAHLDSEIKLVEKTAELLSLNLEQLQEKESGSRFYTKDRDEFFRTTIDKAVQVMKEGKDLDQMTADLDAINNMIERQGRPVFEPQKTARDKIEDGMMRGIATVADLALTKGAMSAVVSGFQTARDGILTGMSEGEALTRGTIQGAVEAATAGVGHLAGKFGMNQAIVMAGTNAAIGTATSFRDRIEQGQDLLSAVTRSLGDGAFAGTTSYVTDKVTDIGLDKAQPYIDQAKTYARTKLIRPFVDKTSPVLKIPAAFKPPAPVADLPPDVSGKLHAARGGIATGPNGEKVLAIEDAKTLMRDSRTGRVMKPNPTEFSDVTEAHANTIHAVKKSHDAATVSDYEKANPLSDAQKAKGVTRRECKVEDFNTPGKKTTMSVDRDQRMVETLYDKDGNVISRREVPRGEWEGHSQKYFAEATNYNEADFRKTLSSGEQKAFDSMSEGEKLKLYQEKHGWKCTDKYHTEASIDNSDQIIDPKTGKRITAGEPNILKVKRGEGTLQDAQGEGLMYVDKVRDAAASEQSVESFAQARKAVETYDGLRDGYAAQNLNTGTVKPGMRETMDVIRLNADAAAQGNPDAINRINNTLTKNGFRNMNDFADKIGGHIESLKWAKPKGG